MSQNSKSQAEDPEVVIEAAIGHSEQFIEKHGKKLLIAIAVVVLCVGGYFAYQNLYKAPQMDKASAAMFEAQYQFEQDSFAVALKGSSSFAGFEKVIAEYGSLPQGNIAKHYAGLCCLYMGDYQKAIEYFSSFASVDGAMGVIITAQNYGLTGDAYVELGDLENGLKMYEKAVATSDNIDTAPTYLKKAALVNENLGNSAAAVEQYNKIKFGYPTSFLARDIDRYIALAEQK